MRNLCVIPARGGSKRIPRKNIKDFLGKPIIAYSIEVAIKSGLFAEVMVSTDDDEIANISKRYGAKIPFMRSKKNADDFSSTSDVLIEVLEEYRLRNIYFDNICCVYPTAPLIKMDKLKLGFEMLKSKSPKSVFPIVSFSYPIWRGLKQNQNNQFEMIWPENLNKRSQDLDNVFHDAGQWYWLNIKKFKKDLQIFGTESSCVVLKETEVQDIDNIMDWKLAELKYELL